MTPRQIVLVLAVAAIGTLIGGLYGSQQDPGFRTTHQVALDEVVRAGDQSGTRVVSFVATLQQEQARERAAAASAFDTSDFRPVFGRRVDDTMVVEVELRTDSAAEASERLDALIEASLLEQIDAERATEQVVIDTASSEVEELRAELDAIYEAVALAPGSDLADQLERDQFSLVSARAQLAELPEDESYWRTRLPGDIEAYEQRISAIDGDVDRWLEVTARLDELDETHGDSVRRLEELEAADDIAVAGTAVISGSPQAISVRANVGRWAATVGALSLLAAVVVVAASSAIGAPAAAAKRREQAHTAAAS